MGVKHWRAKNWILGFVFIMIAIAGVLIFVYEKKINLMPQWVSN